MKKKKRRESRISSKKGSLHTPANNSKPPSRTKEMKIFVKPLRRAGKKTKKRESPGPLKETGKKKSTQKQIETSRTVIRASPWKAQRKTNERIRTKEKREEKTRKRVSLAQQRSGRATE